MNSVANLSRLLSPKAIKRICLISITDNRSTLLRELIALILAYCIVRFVVKWESCIIVVRFPIHRLVCITHALNVIHTRLIVFNSIRDECVCITFRSAINRPSIFDAVMYSRVFFVKAIVIAWANTIDHGELMVINHTAMLVVWFIAQIWANHSILTK
jgi:hypothetical protein